MSERCIYTRAQKQKGIHKARFCNKVNMGVCVCVWCAVGGVWCWLRRGWEMRFEKETRSSSEMTLQILLRRFCHTYKARRRHWSVSSKGVKTKSVHSLVMWGEMSFKLPHFKKIYYSFKVPYTYRSLSLPQ